MAFTICTGDGGELPIFVFPVLLMFLLPIFIAMLTFYPFCHKYLPHFDIYLLASFMIFHIQNGLFL